MININQAQWQRVNNQLNAKIISELHYEELLTLTPIEGNLSNRYQWQSGEVDWQFEAKQYIWGNMLIEVDSLRRNGQKNISSAQLLKDIAQAINLDEIILGNLIEEIQQTLVADLQSDMALAQCPTDKLLNLSGVALQALLRGHPKGIANKGRLGWGTDALAQYTPESGQQFQLHFIAVSKAICSTGITTPQGETHQQTLQRMLLQMMDQDQMATLLQQVRDRGKQLDAYWIIPTHPWQFQQFIVTQFGAQFADDSLIDLGCTGDFYQPQQSIRTLSNVSRPANNDIKLPITILNTSCYRGIPGKYITSGAALSEFIQQRCEQDTFLRQANFKVLKEWAGIHVSNPNQADLSHTPYRYNEMLGVILRQSPNALIAKGQQDKLAAALMQCDAQGNSFIGQYVQASGLSVQTWLTKLFDSTVIPLYHLICQYGIGLVSHGQNLTLLMQHHVPAGLAIKDFHGDLRIIDEDFAEHSALPDLVAQQLTKLPAQYLLHDLYTGHFVTVLRFVSPHLADELNFSEQDFYQLLAQRIVHYQAQFPQLRARFEKFNLLAETMEKVCINRVRFNVGYQDTSERLLPVLGTPINNPLFIKDSK